MSSDSQKDEIAKRAAEATIGTVFRLPYTAARFRANLEEAAYRALSDYEAQRPACEWSGESDDPDGVYETTCGHVFSLETGTPKENGMKFCCYCGKKLVEPPGEGEA